MSQFKGKKVLVIGLDPGGRSTCELLLRSGADVTGIDVSDDAELRSGVEDLRAIGIEVALGAKALPDGAFDFGVLVDDAGLEWAPDLEARGMQVISPLEVAAGAVACLIIAVAGSSGKTTTARLIEQILTAGGRKTAVAGTSALPVCASVSLTRDLDYLIIETPVSQLANAPSFRPSIAVITSAAHGLNPASQSASDRELPYRNLFKNQQIFDWAVVHSQAVGALRVRGIQPPGKVITFSATDATADLKCERGMLIGRMESWQGPLVHMERCKLRGPHCAEDIMAALAVGRILRLPLETMAKTIEVFAPLQHCFEQIAVVKGVSFINDAKCSNLDSLGKSLEGIPSEGAQPNVWLIAGGEDNPDAEMHDAGPVISRRVKHVFLVGSAGEKLRAAWSLFTPCTVVESLVEAVSEAAKNSVSGDAVLFSPACSGFEKLAIHEKRGEEFRQAVKSIRRGGNTAHPNMMVK